MGAWVCACAPYVVHIQRSISCCIGTGNEKNVVVVVCNTNQQRAHPMGPAGPLTVHPRGLATRITLLSSSATRISNECIPMGPAGPLTVHPRGNPNALNGVMNRNAWCKIAFPTPLRPRMIHTVHCNWSGSRSTFSLHFSHVLPWTIFQIRLFFFTPQQGRRCTKLEGTAHKDERSPSTSCNGQGTVPL